MAQITTTQSDKNGNHDSGYAPSNIDDIIAVSSPLTGSPHHATIFENRHIHYKGKGGPLSKEVSTISPRKEPFR